MSQLVAVVVALDGDVSSLVWPYRGILDGHSHTDAEQSARGCGFALLLAP